MVQVVCPQIGERIYDGACGSAGFLCESFDYLSRLGVSPGSVNAKDIDPTTFDLSVKSPNDGEEVVHRSPQDIMDEIAALDGESAEVLATIRGLL